MMTCPDCQTNLDDVPVGTPCPSCASLRRDATVSPPTIGTIAQVFTPSVSVAIDAILARPEVKQVTTAREITLRLSPPSDQDSGWLLEAWDGNDLISFAPGQTFGDVYLAASDEIEDAIRDDGDDAPPA